MRFFVPFYIILFILHIPQGSAQSINFEDGFEDGDFTSDPAWSGDTGQFTVTGSANHLLQLNSPDTDPAYLSTPSTSISGVWDFYVEFDGFEPSGSNRAEIFLMSDISNLEGPVNGYAVQVGQSGDDVFNIVRYEDGSPAATILSDTTIISDSGGGYRVRVTRSDGGSWKLEVGRDYDGVLYDSGATGADTTHTSSSYFGILINYTSSRSDKFLFDFKIDLPPFSVTGAVAEDNRVDVMLNRAYDPTSVQVTDFSIDHGIGIPASADFPDEQTIRLIYDASLPSEKYMLTVQDIEDQHSEEIAKDSVSFIVFGTYTPGDIILNEFIYDPPSGAAEYAELRNTSDKYLNIKDWKLGDNNGFNTITTGTRMLEPDSHLVISADTTALFNIFGHRPYVQMSTFPALNNTGDAVRIASGGGEVADSLTYIPDWGGADVALERRSGSVPSIFSENWGDSPHPLGGTPGRQNTLPPDTTAPVLDKLTILSDTAIHLEFSERVEPESAAYKTHYLIEPKREIESIRVQNATIILFLVRSLQSGQSYRITVENLQDVFGNTMQLSMMEETYRKFASARKNDIVINEILYTRKNGRDPEFVELYNTTDKNFDLSGWKLGDATGTTILGKGTQLYSGGYLVLTDNAAFADSLINVYYLPGFPSLNDAGDTVYLQTDTGQTVDSLFYLPDWGSAEKGISIERRDPLAASNDPSNWQTHQTSAGYSAGMVNASFQPDESPPEIVFSKLLQEAFVEVQFSEFIRLTSDLIFYAGKQLLDVESFDPNRGDRIVLRPLQAKTPNSIQTIKTVTAQYLTDVKGNITSVAEIPVAHRLKPRSLIVNEIMYNPLSDSDDNLPDQSEYVELRNIKDHAVSLEGLYLHDAPDENGEVRSLVPVTTGARWVPAGGTALIYADEVAGFGKSQIADFFEITDHSPASTIRVNRNTLSLASAGDAVYLADSTGTVIDSVHYDESWQNPNLIDTRGIALERINPAGSGNDRTNWGSSTNEKGGTPHAENTLYQISGNAPSQVGISFSPNPFSPDNDGYDDNLLINYKLDEADYLLKVSIYDRYGRLVRKLADGQPAGFEGTLIWDGRKDNGTRNRIGIYIIVFEAFNSNNGKNRAFKKTVVLARRL